MKHLKLIILFFLAIINIKLLACIGLTPAYTYINNHTCGVPAVLSITNTSSGSNAANLKTMYLWKIGGKIQDTTYGLAAPQTLLIKNTGSTPLELIAIDSSGCRDSFSSSITVTTLAPYLLDQNGSTSHTPAWLNCIQFRTDSDSFLINIKSNDTLRNFSVFWGDGQSDTGITKMKVGDSLNHWYVSTGIFEYKVVLYNSSTSCTDTLYGKVINQRQPTAGILGPSAGSNRGCAPHKIQFKSTSYNLTAQTTITWLFGDGEGLEYDALSRADSVQHVYTKALCNGIVTLITKNECGSSQTTWNPIDVSEKDKADISVDTSNCDPKKPFEFINSTADLYCITPDPKEYYWDFGDGTNTGWIKSKASQKHIYSTDGQHTVMLIAKNTCGNDTIYKTFSILYFPKPNFIVKDTMGCQPVATSVADISIGRGITRMWSFGDGTTSTDSTYSHSYTKGGDYILKLSVSNACGSRDTSKLIKVFVKPIAKFKLRGEGCVSYNQSFFQLSTTFSDSTTFAWSFGDGTSSSLKAPLLKSYSIAGKYGVSLIVNNTCGADTAVDTFNAFGFPKNILLADSTVCTFDTFLLSINSDIASSYNVNWGNGKSNNYTTFGIYKHVFVNSGFKTIIITTTGKDGGCISIDTLILNVKPGAFANFGTDKLFACAPSVFTITDSSINTTDYKWYINDSLVSTNNLFNAYTILNDSTIKVLKLVVENTGLCGADSISKTILTSSKPLAAFSLSDTAGCGLLNINTINLCKNSQSYQWKINNNNTSNTFNSSADFAASKTKDTFYNIKLIASNWAGCKDSTQNQVQVYPKPSIDFGSAKYDGCGPLNLSFTNISKPNDTGNIALMTFYWNLANGNTAVTQNAASIFIASVTKDSNYSVKLIGYSEHGCADSLSKIVSVYPKPKATFTSDKNNGCAPLMIKANNNSMPNDTGSINIMRFLWTANNKIDSNVHPSFTFPASLTKDSVFSIKLKAYSEHNCIDSTMSQITVFPNPKADFITNVSQGCTPLSITTTNNSLPYDTGSIAIMTFNWHLGNGNKSNLTSPSTSYISNGLSDSNYQIKLVAFSEHGCKDSISKLVKVFPSSKANFVADKESGCGPLNIVFSEKSINGNSFQWDFGTGFKTLSATTTKTFQPILLFDTFYQVYFTSTTVNNCLGDTVSKIIKVQGIPKASFVLAKDTSCGAQVSLIYNTSLAAYKYQWRLGDSTTSTLINPTHIFGTDPLTGGSKTHKIQLVARSIFGCTDTAAGSITVMPFPKAIVGFDKKSGCGDLAIQFANNSQFANAQNWSFGDGTVSNLPNPSKLFSNNTPINKQYVVSLEAISIAGCTSLDTTTVTVYPNPILSIRNSRLDICDDGIIEFVSNSKNTLNLSFRYNDGSALFSSNLQSTKDTFPLSTFGDTNFMVSIFGTSQFGCKDSIENVITLGPKLFVDFDQTPNSACVPAIAEFKNLSRNAINFIWDFGDNAGSGDINPNHIYQQAGNFSVKLTAFDKNGCRLSKKGANNFLAKETPVAEFVVNPGILKMPNAKATFSNLSIYNQASTFVWDFGDGNSSNLENPVHTYTDSGVYKVSLKADNFSCSNVIIKQVIVSPSLPIVDFDPEGAGGCAPLQVEFKEKTQFANKFAWIFGDGYSSSEANPSHVYENEGFYTVTLMAEGPGGVGRIVKTNIIEVKSSPKCFFYATPDSAHLPNARFDIKNKTVNASNYTWQVNDASNGQLLITSRLKEPSFVINQVGNYDVKLMAENQNNCFDTLVKPLLLIVLEEGKLFIPTAFTPNRDNKNDDFRPVTLGVSSANYTFRIFNRWGEKIFETSDLNGSWDGNVKGSPVAENVFIWTISGQFINGDFFERKGDITLLK